MSSQDPQPDPTELRWPATPRYGKQRPTPPAWLPCEYPERPIDDLTAFHGPTNDAWPCVGCVIAAEMAERTGQGRTYQGEPLSSYLRRFVAGGAVR